MSDRDGEHPTSPEESLAFLVSKVGVNAAQRFAERLTYLDLDRRDVELLRSVAALGHPSPQQLAERLGMMLSRIVPLIHRLEQRGVLERRPHPDDPRAYELHLTGTGRALLVKVALMGAAHEAELSGPLKPDERRTLIRLLRRLAEAQRLANDVCPDGPRGSSPASEGASAGITVGPSASGILAPRGRRPPS